MLMKIYEKPIRCEASQGVSGGEIAFLPSASKKSSKMYHVSYHLLESEQYSKGNQ